MSNKEDMLNSSVREFVAAAAAKTPTPGGGSVAGVVGALGTALGEMTLNFTRGKKKFAEYEKYYAHLGERLEKVRSMFMDLVGDDMAAYQLYQQTQKAEDGPEKDEAMQVATAAAIAVPREMMKLGLALLEDLKELSGKCNQWLISDLVAAAVLAVAAIRLSSYNVRINAPSVADKQAGSDLLAASAADLKKSQATLEEIEKIASQYI